MPHWSDGKVEVNLGVLIGDGRYMLEIVAPYYASFTSGRNTLVHQIQVMREKVFGWAPVKDLSNVPINDLPPEFFDTESVLLAEIYEPETHRMRYQYIGKPKEGFVEENMTWGGQLAIEAPKKEIVDGKDTTNNDAVEQKEISAGDIAD